MLHSVVRNEEAAANLNLTDSANKTGYAQKSGNKFSEILWEKRIRKEKKPKTERKGGEIEEY